MARGLVIVYTGDGKGKTTAALGQALRAAGHGLSVCVLQFIKGKWPTGEARAFQRFLPSAVEFHSLGSGFTWQADPAESRRAAEEGWRLAAAKIAAGAHDLVVLDELTHAINHGLVGLDPVLASLASRPPATHVVVTGRDAPRPLLDAADLVTEMRCRKHPYQQGVKAQKGIEF